MIVAIDGPAASGKSTAAIGVAKALNITHLDTGAMYRAVTFGLIKNQINFKDVKAVEAYLNNLVLKFSIKEKNTALILDNKDITEKIRSSKINENVSEVSAIKIVREFMVKIQRELAKDTDCILEGRDIGTVVFPNADYKFFISLSFKNLESPIFKEPIFIFPKLTLWRLNNLIFTDLKILLTSLFFPCLSSSLASHLPLIIF